MSNKDSSNSHSVHFTSGSQTWNTPLDLFNDLNAIWKFTLDAACIPSSALCTKYFTPEDDGLVQDWGQEIVWCNPPYDDIKSWCDKAVQAYKNGATVMMLIPSRTDTKAFQDHAGKYCDCVCFIKGRLKFQDPTKRDNKSVNSAPFPSCLLVLDHNLTIDKIKFLETLGLVFKRC